MENAIIFASQKNIIVSMDDAIIFVLQKKITIQWDVDDFLEVNDYFCVINKTLCH